MRKVEMKLLMWILVILIINKDITSGEEESRKLKLSFPEELRNEFRLKETILDLLRRKLGFPVQKFTPEEKDRKKQNLKKQSQKVHIMLLQSNSRQKEYDQIENFKLIGDLNLAEFGHLTYNKEKGFLDFDESELDKDQLAAMSIPNIMRISEENHYKTGKYQIEGLKTGRDIGQIDGIGKAGREGKCKEGTYRLSGECNLCECIESEWKCTDVICIKNHWLQDLDNRHRMLAGDSKEMYQKLRNQATGCMPGDTIQPADSNDCPCKCVLPSVIVCEICPAVKKIHRPRKKETTKAPGTEPDYQYHYD